MRLLPDWNCHGDITRYVIQNWLIGGMAGAVCALLVLVTDTGHLRTLLASSDAAWQGMALLFGGFILTFAGVVCATAVMYLPSSTSNKDGV